MVPDNSAVLDTFYNPDSGRLQTYQLNVPG